MNFLIQVHLNLYLICIFCGKENRETQEEQNCHQKHKNADTSAEITRKFNYTIHLVS